MKMMYTCREMVEVVSRELDTPLTVPEKVRMVMHLSMCAHCRTYREQIQQVDEFLKNRSGDALEVTLSDERRGSILAVLEDLE